jgi:site-specific recombinase XerD
MISTTIMTSSQWSEAEKARDWERLHQSTQLLPPNNTDQPAEAGDPIEAWLEQSYAVDSGTSTVAIYRKLLHSLRTYLHSHKLDLNSPRDQVIQPIQVWASLRASNSKHQGRVAPSTYNQRIAAISSYYTWASKNGYYAWANPVNQLGRTVVRKYAGSQALDVQEVCRQIKQIDLGTERGQRDYVLLQVALDTGRSARELASLTWNKLSFQDTQVTLLFDERKSGKIIYDTLDPRLSQTLLDYLRAIYGENLTDLGPHTPIWISFSDRTYRQAIGQQTIADICTTHLGVSKVHSLRHTFALTMDQLGIPVDTIQARLGHRNRTTTDTYLTSLKQTYLPEA